MYKFFGWLNVVLVVLITAHYWLRLLNQYVIHSKSPAFLKTMGFLRKAHKPLALVLVASILAHGYLAMGGQLRLHTGTIVAAAFLVTILFGALYFWLRKPWLLKTHRALMFCSLVLVVVHLVAPNAVQMIANTL